MAGAGIPAAATVLFNTLNTVFDNHGVVAGALPETTYEFASGCLFALIGIGVTAKDIGRERLVQIGFAGLILALFYLEYVGPALGTFSRLTGILLMDGLSLIALSAAIVAVDDP